MPHSLWWLLVDGLATYRLVLLVTRDTITLRGRTWLYLRGYRNQIRIQDGAGALQPKAGAFAGAARWLHELVSCPWCVGLWLAGVVVAFTACAPRDWQYVALALACSAVAGFLAERTG